MTGESKGNDGDSARMQRIREAGKRAIVEAEKRRNSGVRIDSPVEMGGRDGPEPTRFGDWEKDGIVSDF